MNWFTRIWTSSIGKKVLVAVTGLGLLGFLFGHLFGNLQIFWGAGALNAYAAGLHEYWFLPLAELAIFAAFIVHVVLVIKLTLENKKARGVPYAVKSTKNPGFKYTSSVLMRLSGLVVLTFLVIHILDYRVLRDLHDAALVDCLATGVSCEDTVGGRVTSTLMVPWRAALYTVGSLFVGWHLYHGIGSAARSFGVASPKWTPIIDKAGAGIGIGLGVLFAIIPVAILATGGAIANVNELGPETPVVAGDDTVQVEALGEQVELDEADAPAVLVDDADDVAEAAADVAADAVDAANTDAANAAAEAAADAPAGDVEGITAELAENGVDAVQADEQP